MSLSGTKKSPFISIPFLKKRLRRITALGIYNLIVNEFYFTVHFTLHRNENTIAFYQSEPIENQRSPEWSYFKFPASVQCLQEFVMRVWITSSNTCRLFLEYNIYLDNSLLPDEQNNEIHTDNNSLWLEMFGYRFTDKTIQLVDEDPLSLEKRKRLTLTKSYNKLSILRMNNIIHAIYTEKQAAKVWLERLQTFFDKNEDYLLKIKECESRRLRIENLKKYLDYQRYIQQQGLTVYKQKQKMIEERKNQLHSNLLKLRTQQEEINSSQNYLNRSKSILQNLKQINLCRQKHILNDIYLYIYPIQRDNQNQYSIANIMLPQADNKIYQAAGNRERDNEIAAAIAYCSHFVLIISQFIQLPLRFPIDYHEVSDIKIYDYNLETTEFPLYPTTDLSSFRYGFYLLNRNIGQMMYHCRVGGRNADYRKTLENLKELIEEYFMNAKDPNQIQLHTWNSQNSVQMITSTNNFQEQLIPNKQNSLFLSSSSVIENNDYENMDLFPRLNTIKPRLAMQISHNLQQ